MPLFEPEFEREPVRARAMECRGFRREDGLRDIEGRLTERFLDGFGGEAKPGEPLHDM